MDIVQQIERAWQFANTLRELCARHNIECRIMQEPPLPTVAGLCDLQAEIADATKHFASTLAKASSDLNAFIFEFLAWQPKP